MDAVLVTPFVSPAALGLPLGSWLDGFRGEACREAAQTFRLPLETGEPDAVQIIRYLQKLAVIYGRNKCTIDFARCLVADIADQNAKLQHFQRVTSFVLDKFVYLADPRGIEYVRSPVQLLLEFERTGKMRGDCDDVTLLTNSLLNALGFTTRTLSVKINGSTTFNHVLCLVQRGEDWVPFDACNRADPTAQPPDEQMIAV